jgi:hypothetical protein
MSNSRNSKQALLREVKATLTKIMRKKLLKVIPVWVIILLATAGSAAAVYNYISNNIYSQVTVTTPPIVITGTFPTAYAGVQQNLDFSYTSSADSPHSGFLLINFVGGFTSTSDVSVSGFVIPNDGGQIDFANYRPVYVGNENIEYFIGSSGSNPIDFGHSGGHIILAITYANAGSVSAMMQVSSTTG